MKKLLASFLSFLLVFEPFAINVALYRSIAATLPYGLSALIVSELFKSTEAFALGPLGADAGEALGQSQLGIMQAPGNLPHMNAGNTQIVLPTASPASQTHLNSNLQPANGSLDDTAPTAATFGDPNNYDLQFGAVATRVLSESSPPGEAYRAIVASKKRRVNYTNAPFLAPSKVIQQTAFTGCTTSTTRTTTANPVDLFTEKSCVKVSDTLKNCNVTRNVIVHTPPVTGQATYDSATTEKSNFDYVSHNPGSNCNWMGSCTKYSLEYWDNIYVTVDWTKVSSAVATIKCDDGCILQYKNEDTGGNYVNIPSTQAGVYPSASCGETGGDHQSTVDITSIVKRSGGGSSNLYLQIHSCTTDGGYVSGNVIWNVTAPMIEDRGFIDTPTGCWATQFSNKFCHADSWTCSDNAPRMVGGTAITLPMLQDVGGNAIWSDNSPVTNKGGWETGNVCWKASGTDLCNFSSGTIGCFLAADGVTTVCPNNDGTVPQDGCARLEADGCIWDREGCTTGSFDTTTGTCMVPEEFYKCDVDTVNVGGDVVTTPTISCAATRCMGNECGTPVNESNNDFGAMRGISANMGSMGRDGKCNATTCELFSGKKLQCRTFLGGNFDCCNKNMPSVNYLTYMQLGYKSYQAAQEMGWLQGMPDVTGYTATLGRELGNSVIKTANELIGEPLISQFQAVGANSTAAGAPGVFASIESYAINQVGTWVASTFGPSSALTTTLFTQNPATKNYAFASNPTMTAMKSVYTAFMWAYLAYMVLTILTQCNADEYELAAQKAMRSCHQVGSSYCTSGPADACWEKTTTFCCYGTALSRIIQEQVRKQGLPTLDWGTAETPKCDGLTPADLSSANWNKDTGGADLSEYIAMMVKSDLLPESGEEEDFYNPSTLGKNSVDLNTRTLSRGPGSPGLSIKDSIKKITQSDGTTGIQVDNVRNNATQAASSAFPPP